MGDCFSRPNESQVANHKKRENKRNEKNFIDSIAHLNKSTLGSLSLDTLKKINEDIDHEQQVFYEKIENSTAGMPSIPEILVEVQKGVDLYKKECLYSQLPMVKISLEPKGPSFNTFNADKYLPEWFKLVRINQNLLGFTTLKVSVFLVDSDQKEEFLGKHDFSLIELEDQRIREGWYKIETERDNEGLNPKIQLRIQLINDYKAIYTVLIKESNDILEQVTEVIATKEASNLKVELS